MAARAPRAGRCPATAGGSRGGSGRPAMTRTEMLRQAKTAAVVQKEPRPKPERAGGCPGARPSLSRRGPPPPDPRKVDFKSPGLTKSMLARQKSAAEKMKRYDEERQRAEDTNRCPRRTPAPPGGDARAARRAAPARGDLTRLNEAVACGRVTTRRGGDGPVEPADEAIARGHVVVDRRGAIPKKPRACPAPRTSRRGPLATATPIPAATKAFARSMNAQVVQAVPMSDGPVDKIIIDRGVVSDDRSTIVCIAKPPGGECGAAAGPSNAAAHRSIQVISESLDEQDAVESATVQGKLGDLQQARRDFVIAVANVGGNAVNISDDADCSILDEDDMPGALDFIPTPPPPPRKIYNIPDVSHPMFQPQYGRDHPSVVAAREFSRRTQCELDQRAAERRIEEGFACRAAQDADDLRFDTPFEQDIMEGDISFEEDEEGHMNPCASRIKASMPPIPTRNEPCPQPPITIEDLQRFMDLENFPPTPPACNVPPTGRENLHPDLWELEDPWYHEATQPSAPDLMCFDSFY